MLRARVQLEDRLSGLDRRKPKAQKLRDRCARFPGLDAIDELRHESSELAQKPRLVSIETQWCAWTTTAALASRPIHLKRRARGDLNRISTEAGEDALTTQVGRRSRKGMWER